MGGAGSQFSLHQEGCHGHISKQGCVKSWCGGICEAPVLLVCDEPCHGDYNCDTSLIASEDLPTYVPGGGASSHPSHWRRLFQTPTPLSQGAPKVPPLRLPSGKGATMKRLSPKCRCSPREADQNASNLAGLRRDSEGAEMPRLSPAAWLQIAREELEAYEPQLGHIIADSPVHVHLHVESPGRPQPECQEAAYLEAPVDLLTVPAGIAARASVETPLPRTERSDGSGSWIDVDLSDTCRRGSPPCPREPRAPPYTPPLLRRRVLQVEEESTGASNVASPDSSPWTPQKDSPSSPPAESSDSEEVIKTMRTPVARVIEASSLEVDTLDEAFPFRDPSPIELPAEHFYNGSFAAWSSAVVETIASEYSSAIFLVPRRPLEFFCGYKGVDDTATSRPVSARSCSDLPPDLTRVDQSPGGELNDVSGDVIEIVFATLADVSGRPFPLELLMLQMAFGRLSRTGAGKACGGQLVNSRHPEVEAILLKYTVLPSRLTLRAELEAWFPRGEDGKVPRPGSSSAAHMEGPDDFGPTLSFESLAAFISTHAAPVEHLRETFDTLPAGTSSDRHGSARKALQHALEVALAPLLAGLPSTIAGNGRNATAAGRRIARRAAELAVRGREKSAPPSGDMEDYMAEISRRESLKPADFGELFWSAASMTRLCVMYLTEDAVRWRNCIASASPRVDLQHSLGGG